MVRPLSRGGVPVLNRRTRAVHGRAFGAIEEPKLDTGGVGDDAHDSPQGVDFANHLAFGDTTDGRVTAHLADGVGIHGE